MMSDDDLLKKLDDWLKHNTLASLAHYLSYKSTTTIAAWRKKKKIPHHMRDRVLEVITKHGRYKPWG